MKTIGEVVDEIIAYNDKLRDAWANAFGWAPMEAAALLARSRLDRQVSLSHCLKVWIEPFLPEEEEGRLILAWANLGALVEGTMKTCLSTFYREYSSDPHTRGRDKKVVEPDELSLEELRAFFQKRCIWIDRSRDKWDKWIRRILERRNAIHAYKHRDLGTFREFQLRVRQYLCLIGHLDRAPHPESQGY